MGFSRQEYCSGLPCPPTGDLHDMTQGSNLCLLRLLCCQVGALPLVPPGKPGDSNRCVQMQQMHSLMFKLPFWLVLSWLFFFFPVVEVSKF